MSLKKTFLDDFDAEALIKETESSDSRQVKRNLIKQGFKYQRSIYGAARATNTDQGGPMRIEILSDHNYTEADFYLIDHFFDLVIPGYGYSIWRYREREKKLAMVKGYDGRNPNRI